MSRLALLLALGATWAAWPAGPETLATVKVLDVGQGDAILVVSRGHAMLVDGGPARAAAAAKARPHLSGASLDLVVATHADDDHVGGLADVLRDHPRAAVARPEDSRREGAWPLLLSHLAEARHRRAAPGVTWVGAVEVDLIGPPAARVPGGANENGIVVALRLGPWRALLPGDAGVEREARLLAGPLRSARVDLLALGHHGSGSATSERWLDSLGPSAAFCSAGSRNRYGHPDPDVLDRLAVRGIGLACTDREGTLRYTFTPAGASLVSDAAPKPRRVVP